MIEVRPVAARDLPACAATFEAAWNNTFPHWPRRVGVADFIAETADEIVFVAAMTGRVCGFASLYAPESFLHLLYVAPAAQSQGVGSALLRTVLRNAAAPLSLKCQITNTRARAFYAKHGFAEAGVGEDEFGRWVRLKARSS